MSLSRAPAAACVLAQAQGAFYLASGVWPIVHLASFEAVTGPKVDGWLVKTTGAVIAVAGASMLTAGRSRRVMPEAKLLAAGSAAALAAADLVYVAKRRISPVYLLDAAVELALLAAWAAVGRR